jgi:hypothetical protein
MYMLGGGSRQPAFQFPATDIPSSSTPPMFQAQPSAFDTGTQDQLAWDEFGYGAILATMDGAPQQADELGTSQLTQTPPVLTQPSQFAAGGATTANGATPTGGGASPAGGAKPDTTDSSQAAMATPSTTSQDRGSSGHLTTIRTTGTTSGLALELLGGRGAGAFSCSTMILHKLFPCDYV